MEATPTPIAPRTFRILTLLTPQDLSAPTPPRPQLQETAGAYVIRQGALSVALYRRSAPANLSGERKILVKLA
jgi:hypothetical protein